jgi:tRNA pseudouridine55 synthase
VNGVLLIDKPVGITSHDVVAAVRRSLGGVKTGHAGTLDPFASGLLLVLVGRATRIQDRLMGLPKRYETIAQLGAVSSTGDPEGEITCTGKLPPDPPLLPTGELRQRPPIYSAIKIGGERAYKRARRGERFEMPERVVTVHRFEQLWRDDNPAPSEVAHPEVASSAPSEVAHPEVASPAPSEVAHPEVASPTPPEVAHPRAAFLIECSSGTYVRSLIADLADAYCVELRRTAIGPFRVEDAVAPPRRGEPWEPEPIAIEQALALLD